MATGHFESNRVDIAPKFKRQGRDAAHFRPHHRRPSPARSRRHRRAGGQHRRGLAAAPGRHHARQRADQRAIEPIERAEAKERQAAADKAAKATGKARHTHDKAEAIVAAAEAAPDEFGKLLADIDRTGRHRDRSGT